MAITKGLFGYDPYEIQMQQQQRLMQPIAQATNPYERIGAGLGTLLGASLFDIQDPRLARAAKLNNIMKQVMGENADPTSKDFVPKLEKLAETLLAEGEVDAAAYALEQAKKFTKTESSAFAKIDPKDYTPESVKVFARTQDYGSLVPRDKPGASYRTLTAAETRARGLDPRMTYQLEEGTNKVTQIGQGPAVVFNAPLVGAENEFAKNVGKNRAERDIAQFGAAEAAVENLPKINETLNELKTGQAFTGAFAEIQKNIQKAQAKFADDRKAGKRVSDTEYLDALLGSDVFPMIGALGIGARGLDTPAEREFLRQVMTGTISLEKDTLVRMTELRKNIAERAVNKFNNRVDKGELKDFFKYQGTDPQKFEIPKFEPRTPAPSAVPQQGGGWSIKKVQ
jgi:hypothetical protein